jgi:hypothetical protein
MKKGLIVLAQPEPTSLARELVDVAVRTLLALTCVTCVVKSA